MKRGWLIGAMMLLLVGTAWATIDAYEFKSPEDEQRFRVLVEELRCPKCQNQNISDSNAGLAKDIKDRAYRLINEGKSNSEITAYMVERFGDFITYRPPVRPVTWFLWFGPFVLAVLAGLIILTRKLRQPRVAVQVSPEQEARVQALLQQLDQVETGGKQEETK
ncbi:MAG TPA: cytochrome c-type biogenesis protein [Dongiaceae bacterium]|nr:cytochrome c-type biogenesis protein [Dongiaceae bacterium]